MSRLTAATVVVLALIAASFGADLWLEGDAAKSWGGACVMALFVYAVVLFREDGE